MAEFDCKVEHFPPCPKIVQLHYLVKYNVQCTRWTVEQLYNVHVIFTCMNETVCLLFEQLFAWGHPCHLRQNAKDCGLWLDNRNWQSSQELDGMTEILFTRSAAWISNAETRVASIAVMTDGGWWTVLPSPPSTAFVDVSAEGPEVVVRLTAVETVLTSAIVGAMRVCADGVRITRGDSVRTFVNICKQRIHRVLRSIDIFATMYQPISQFYALSC